MAGWPVYHHRGFGASSFSLWPEDFVKSSAVYEQRVGEQRADEQRVGWVDCCKGICILLVVFGHVVGGLEASGALVGDKLFDALREWVYKFHIPAFFFLSGLFARKACDRPLLEFLRNRARVLLYPYLVWTLVIVISQAAMGPMVNTPPSIHRALQCLWKPYGVGLWFLYSLFLVSSSS